MIETRGLRKAYRTKKRRQVTTVDAVRGIDLTVAEGEIFGFLGPNGAGKTTTLRMLATLLTPDGGEAIVAGADLLANPREVRRRIGYVAQSGSTWDEVSAREELALQARMYGAPKAEAERRGGRRHGLVWPVRASPTAGARPTPAASGARSTSRSASSTAGFLFLDEPTAGLDPAEPAQPVGRDRPAARRRHDRLPNHSLPGGGRRAVRPDRDHRPGRRLSPRARRTSSSGRSPVTWSAWC